MRVIYAAITAIVVTALCGTPAQVVDYKKMSVEDEVRLVILKRVIQPYLYNNKGSVCVAVDDNKNPSRTLMNTLKELSKSVKPNSRCYLDHRDGDSVRDSVTGKDSVLISVSKLNWLSNDRVQLRAGSYIGNMASDGCKYVLERENGQWQITSSEECYIS